MAEGTFLERIVVATRARLAERQAQITLAALREQAAQQPPALDFAAALRPTDGGVRAIAEFKRASPSKGVIHERCSPRGIANKYIQGGAAAISVLTEQDFFQGSLDDLRAVKRADEGVVPVLRKDFIIDPYQVVEARANGADSYLLIVALLDDDALRRLIAVGRELGMEPLVEVHDAAEAQRAVSVGARVIGVNARDLRTFQVDTTLLRAIRPLIPGDRIVVAESGIATMSDVARLRGYGAQAILVGETLMRATNARWALQQLIELPPALRRIPAHPRPMIKLCGVQTPEDALAAYAAGADLIGLVFVPGKRRQVSVEQAKAIIRKLPDDALTVGLFIAEQAEQRAAIEKIIAATGIKLAHLCGVASASGAFSRMSAPTLRASYLRLAHVTANMSENDTWQPHPALDPTLFKEHSLPIFDASLAEELGGTGKTGDWERAAQEAARYPILLAGGLTPANVGDAIRQVQPWGVDVSSGIEDASGQKDPARMRAFVQAVHQSSKG